MSLLDKLDSEKYKPENRGHPSEGMLHRGTFTIIEGGSSHSYAVKQYPNITMEMLKSGHKLSGETVLTEGEFEMCYTIYNIQANVYLGQATQEELDEAVTNVQSNQVAQKQAQQQSGVQTAPAPGSQPQQQPAAPNKASLQDVAKILVNDIDGALGKPVYQITSELAAEIEKKGFDLDDEDEFYPLVDGWKNGVIKIEQDGSFDESLLENKEEDEEDE